MYKSFQVSNFRCFEDVAVAPLDRINLIAGKNNVGKTALLEALWLHHEHDEPKSALYVNWWRGLGNVRSTELLWELFLNFDPQKTVELVSVDDSEGAHSLRISVRRSTRTVFPPYSEKPETNRGQKSTVSGAVEPVLPAKFESEVVFDYSGPVDKMSSYVVFVGPDGQPQSTGPTEMKKSRSIFLWALYPHTQPFLAERLSDLLEVKRQHDLIELLRIVEPRLKDLMLLQHAGGPMICGDLGEERLMPVPLMGDGMVLLLRIALALMESQNEILLVDEFENGFHYSVLPSIWRAVASLARTFNVQVFATTHSLECIRAAHEAFRESEIYDFRLHRLDRVDGTTIRSVTYDREGLEFALESGWEVRG